MWLLGWMCATTAASAAAEDGTVVLDGRPETGRRLIKYRTIFLNTSSSGGVCRCHCCGQEWLCVFCFGPCVFSSVSNKETDKPSTPRPPGGQHGIKSWLASAPNLFSVTQKIWAKISIFFKKGNLLIHEATVLKVSSVLFSCSKFLFFFFFPKKRTI